MAVQLFNTLTRRVEEFIPFDAAGKKAGMYCCGPTVYDFGHIGNFRTFVSADLVRRFLEFRGYKVTHVMNITDVEDKIINAANERGEDPMALADRYARDYNVDMARFNVRAPDVEPRVSTHISEIIALIEKLMATGKAYPVAGDVYFACETFPPYGRLSGQKLDDLQAGARVEVDERKRAPADFALWKAAKPGEPFWESPWGKGRPGWHIECSAMVVTHLGVTFDVHGGGKDLIFPHHENEIAQSQGAYGESTFARYWLHNGFLNFEGEKMSKSLGNVFGCEQIAEAVGGEALRFFCVSHHYQSPIEFEVEEVRDPDGKPVGVRFRSLEAADRSLEYFYSTLRRIDQFVAQGGDGGEGGVVSEAEKLVPTAREALADNFNTPEVMAAMHAAAALANRLLDEGKGIDKQQRRRTLARLGKDMRMVGSATGILENEPAKYLAARRDRLVRSRKIDIARVEQLMEQRRTARAEKRFTDADAMRSELLILGVVVEDTPQGTDWRVSDHAT